MRLTEHLPPSLVKVPLEAKERTQVITELVDLIAGRGLTEARDQLLAAVLERERQRTTGIGRGFAIPHAKCDAVRRLTIAFGRTAQPIDFAAVDGQPVTLVALLASPTSATSLHIQALARLSRLVTRAAVMEGLLAAKTSEEFYRIIQENDFDG